MTERQKDYIAWTFWAVAAYVFLWAATRPFNDATAKVRSVTRWTHHRAGQVDRVGLLRSISSPLRFQQPYKWHKSGTRHTNRHRQ